METRTDIPHRTDHSGSKKQYHQICFWFLVEIDLESVDNFGYNTTVVIVGGMAFMKDLRLLVWLTQLGLSVAFPLGGFILIGIWLNNRFGLGIWTVFAGLALGIVSAVRGFRDSVQVMEKMSGQKKQEAPSPVAFNEHN